MPGQVAGNNLASLIQERLEAGRKIDDNEFVEKMTEPEIGSIEIFISSDGINFGTLSWVSWLKLSVVALIRAPQLECSFI